MIWVTLFMLPKMFNKATSEAGLFSKSSCLAPDLGVSKFANVKLMILVTLFMLLKSDLDFQKNHRRLWFVEQNVHA
jgi:hypothetical protein